MLAKCGNMRHLLHGEVTVTPYELAKATYQLEKLNRLISIARSVGNNKLAMQRIKKHRALSKKIQLALGNVTA